MHNAIQPVNVVQPGVAVASASVSIVSTLAVLSMLAYILLHAKVQARTKNCAGARPEILIFLRSHFGRYSLCLLFANLLSAIAGMIDFSWISNEAIGPTCTAQGILMQLGDFAGAYFSCVLAIHVYCAAVLQKRRPRWLCVIVVIIGWSVSLITALVPLLVHKRGYASVGFWCSINRLSALAILSFLLSVLPALLATFMLLAIYTISYLYVRSNPNPDEDDLLEKSTTLENRAAKWDGHMESITDYAMFLRRIFRILIWYPITFTILMIPFIVVSNLSFSELVAPGGLAVAAVFHNLVGCANSIIFLCVVRAAIPAIAAAEVSDTDSFFAPEQKNPTPVVVVDGSVNTPTTPKEDELPFPSGMPVRSPIDTRAPARNGLNVSFASPTSPTAPSMAVSPSALARSTSNRPPLPAILLTGPELQKRERLYTGSRAENIISCDRLNADFAGMNEETVKANTGLPPPPPRPPRPAQIRKSILDQYVQQSALPHRKRHRSDMPESPVDPRHQTTWSMSDDGFAVTKCDGGVRVMKNEQATLQLVLTPKGSPKDKALTITTDNDYDDDDRSVYSLNEQIRMSFEARPTGDEGFTSPCRLDALASLVSSPSPTVIVLPEPARTAVGARATLKRHSSDSAISLVDVPFSSRASSRTHFTGRTFGLPASPSPNHSRNNSVTTSQTTTFTRSTTTTRHHLGHIRQSQSASSFQTFVDRQPSPSQFPMSRARTAVAQRPAFPLAARSPLSYETKGQMRRPSADDVFNFRPRRVPMPPTVLRVMNEDVVPLRTRSPSYY